MSPDPSVQKRHLNRHATTILIDDHNTHFAQLTDSSLLFGVLTEYKHYITAILMCNLQEINHRSHSGQVKAVKMHVPLPSGNQKNHCNCIAAVCSDCDGAECHTNISLLRLICREKPPICRSSRGDLYTTQIDISQ